MKQRSFLLIFLACVLLIESTGCTWAKERQLRGIQLGARADLELLRKAEDAYRVRAKSYTTDLGSLPFARKDLKSLLYKFGFTVPSKEVANPLAPPALDVSRTDLDKLLLSRPDIEIGFSPTTRLNKIDFKTLKSFCTDCTATATTFKALAAANLDDDADLDLWTITEKGDVVHLVDDLKGTGKD